MSFDLKLIYEDKETVIRQYPLKFGAEFFLKKSTVTVAPSPARSAASALQAELNRLQTIELNRLYARYSRVIHNNTEDT